MLQRATGGCCLAGALVALLPGTGRAQERVRPFSFEYGVYAGGLGLFNSTISRPAPARTRLRMAASLTGRLRLDLASHLWQPSRGVSASLDARLSGLGGHRFYGFGNRTTAPQPAKYYGVERYQLTLEPTLGVSSSGGAVAFGAGPVFKYTSSESPGDDGPRPRAGEAVGLLSVERPYGTGRFSQVGLQTSLRLQVGEAATGSAGAEVQAGASAYPRLLDVTEAFAEVHAEVKTFVRTGLPADPTLVFRLGGKRIVGSAPYHEAAYVGGSRSLRGYGSNRFAGDASLYGGAELRLTVGRGMVFGRAVEYGVLGLADAGRVFYRGRSPGGWHSAVGAGVWIRPAGGQSVSLALASGAEGSRLHVGLAFPY